MFQSPRSKRLRNIIFTLARQIVLTSALALHGPWNMLNTNLKMHWSVHCGLLLELFKDVPNKIRDENNF